MTVAAGGNGGVLIRDAHHFQEVVDHSEEGVARRRLGVVRGVLLKRWYNIMPCYTVIWSC